MKMDIAMTFRANGAGGTICAQFPGALVGISLGLAPYMADFPIFGNSRKVFYRLLRRYPIWLAKMGGGGAKYAPLRVPTMNTRSRICGTP